MNLQKHIKEIVITLSVISITAGAYATLSNVNTGDGLTATLWNSMVADVNSSTSKLANVTSDGTNVGIGVASPSYNLEVKGAGSSSVFRLLNDTYGILNLGVDVNQPWLGTQTNNDLRVVTNNVERIRVKNDGYVGIGTSNPIGKLHVNGMIMSENSSAPADKKKWNLGTSTDGTFYIQGINDSGTGGGNAVYFTRGTGPQISQTQFLNSGNPFMVIDHYSTYVGIGTTAPSQKFHVNGTALATAWNTTSDIRKKENVKPIVKPLEKIEKLRGVTFNWKDTKKGDTGVIAQEVEKEFPEFVTTGTDGYKSVDYAKLVAPLIESVKELKKENDDLKKRIEALENK